MLLVLLLCLASIVGGYPVDDTPNQYTILYDGPDGRHVQMGEPGKRVTGYFTSRSLDGQEELRTDYVADEKGYRPVGEHLPVRTAKFRSEDVTSPYVFNYDVNGQSHYQTGEPGKAVEGSFMFYDAEGRSHRVDYIADEKGYRIKSVDDATVETDAAEKESIEVVSDRRSEEEAPAPQTDSVIYAVESLAQSPQSDETAKESEIPVQQVNSDRESPSEPAGMPHHLEVERDELSDKEAADDASEKKPVEESPPSDVSALEPVGAAVVHQTQEEEESVGEPKQGDSFKGETPISDPMTKKHVSSQPESEQVNAELKSTYEVYNAALRSALGGSFKDEKHAFNYPFYSAFAPAFYAQQRRYPFGYAPYHYQSHAPHDFGYQYPYRFIPYYFY